MNFLQETRRLWTEHLDPRVADFPLIHSSYHVPLIIFAYLYFVLRCGPRFMKNRQPYSLKTFIKLYNFIQIVANAWLVYEYIDAGVFNKSNLVCLYFPKYQVFYFSYEYILMKLCKIVWYNLLLKILDYVETAIFILRKKNNQVSSLHLYHHVSTLFVAWLSIRYFLIAPVLLISALNNFVHVIMYTYYFLASFGPNVQKIVAPMKQWITIAQMVQFVILIIHASQDFLPNCKVLMHWWVIIYIGNLIMNFYMFYNFYQKAYNKPKRKI